MVRIILSLKMVASALRKKVIYKHHHNGKGKNPIEKGKKKKAVVLAGLEPATSASQHHLSARRSIRLSYRTAT